MTAWRMGLRLLRQDWRSGELHLLSAALVLTVAAITTVGFFTDRVAATMERQGTELIAADLAVESTSALPEDFAEKASSLGLATAGLVEFRSVVMADGATQLVELKAVDAAYPLRGAVYLADPSGGPERSAEGGPPPGEVWVEARLPPLLGVGVGDSLGIGRLRLRIGAILTKEPDRSGGFFGTAPRAILSRSDLAASGLIGPASRATYRLLVAGAPEAVALFRDWVAPRLPANAAVQDARDARPELATAFERASRFLRLATLVTLLVAGAAIALASHRLVQRQIDAVAVMRCLGAPRHLLIRVFVLRLILLGLLASLLGCLAGWVGHLGLAAALSAWLAPDLPAPSLAPLAMGVGTGLIVLLGFALPPLLQLARVPPLHVIRRDLGPPRFSATLTLAASGCALALLVLWQANDFALAWRLLAGVLAALVALVVTVLGLVRLAAGLAARSRGVWRLGLASLSRRPGTAVLQITGLGIGILALLLLSVVRVDLLAAWRESLPAAAPNQFLINIQPHEVEPLKTFLHASGIEAASLYPMIRGRLIRINADPVEPSAYQNPRAERLASRELNLSYADRPAPDNRIVAGSWWSDADPRPQLSVEEGIAETLGIELGDVLTFWVSGHEVSAPVTSLRKVQWDSFNVNFFVTAAPVLLRDEAATYITSFYLSAEQQTLVAELVRRFPSVTVLDVESILRQVRQVVDRGVLAVEYVFLFTLLAGMLVLYAGIQVGLEQRRAEQGVLRTLGASRRALLVSLAVELTATGLLAGLLASIFAEATSFLLAEQIFGFELRFNPALWALGALGSGLVVGLLGTLATFPFLIGPPLRAIRGDG